MDWQFEEIQDLREDVDLEVKLAQGKDGKGALPNDFWPSYSAMANTQGGLIILGVKEDKKSGKLVSVGLSNPEKVLKSLWDGLNNPQMISVNLLENDDVQIREIKDNKIIQIRVPAASRLQPTFTTSSVYQRQPCDWNLSTKL